MSYQPFTLKDVGMRHFETVILVASMDRITGSFASRGAL